MVSLIEVGGRLLTVIALDTVTVLQLLANV
jgi:hypothetical protein